MSTLLPPGQGTITNLWATACAIREVDLSRVARDPAPALFDGPQHEPVPLDSVLIDTEALRSEFRAAMTELSTHGVSGGIPGPELIAVPPADLALHDLHIDLTAEVWRAGYEVPQKCSPADLTGWCFLHATTPRHEDSGSVAILDPRAGSERTAMPGLPWGREYTFRSSPGLLAVAPGWLTSTVRPLEDGQNAVVVVAHATT